jgi:tRNA threonylcarbamoyladenosine biosynthesis protein TsaE
MQSHLRLPDESATLSLGAALGPGARNGLVLHLQGNLGVGKTTLVRGLLQALGYAGRVKSPTYGLVEPYELSRLHLYHFDFYRFKDQAEWLSSGFQDHFGPEALCIVEWPERAHAPGPPADLAITLRHLSKGREVDLTPGTPEGEAWLAGALSRWPSSASASRAT